MEWSAWGDEIIYNDTDRNLSIELRDHKNEAKVITLPACATDTLVMPNFTYHICIQSSCELNIYEGEELLANFIREGDSFFIEYHYMFEGRDYIEDRMWPRYGYYITKDVLSGN